MSVLREVDYPGFHPPATEGKVAYVVRDSEVYFTALQSSRESTSSINAAEDIITAICEAEDLRWQECTFFDIQTRVGYPFHGEGYYCIDKLRVVPVGSGNYIHVETWYPVGMSDVAAGERGIAQEKLDKLPGIPNEVFELFRDFIYPEGESPA